MAQYLDIDAISDIEELRKVVREQTEKAVREAENADCLQRRLTEKEEESERLFNINNGHLDTIAYLANKVMKLEAALDKYTQRRC